MIPLFELLKQASAVAFLHRVLATCPVDFILLGLLPLVFNSVVDVLLLHGVPFRERRDVCLEVVALPLHQHLVVVLVGDVLHFVHLFEMLQSLIVGLPILLLLLLFQLFNAIPVP